MNLASFKWATAFTLHEIGDNTCYTQVNIIFNSIVTAGRVTGSVTPGMYSEISSSGLNVSKKLNRYYTITNDGLSFSDYSATFTYDSGDIDAGASPDSFIVKQYDGNSWITPTVHGTTDTSISITGATSFSDFVIGEVAPLNLFFITVNSLHGSVILNPEKPLYTYGEVVHLTAMPDFGYHFTHWGDDLSGNANPDSLIITKEISITANFEPTVLTQLFRPGWNLVSVPATVADYRKSILFPSAVSDAYAYNGVYISKDTLVNMKGYWLKFAQNESLSVSCDYRLLDSVDVANGWNIIGTISAPISVAEVCVDSPGLLASSFFGYTTTYLPVDSLFPGNAYWIKTNKAGRIYLGASAQKK